MSFIDEIVNQIRNGRVAIFAGAGISRPSGLPDAREIIVQVVEELAAHSSLPGHALNELKDRAPAELRLEILLRILIDVVGERGLVPLRLLSGGQPAVAHRFIAACMASGLVTTVVTTNFDTLIEHACSDAGTSYGSLVSPDEFRTSRTRSAVIAKLHGSLDLSTGSPPPDVLAEIRRVGQGLGDEREGWFRRTLREKHLLVLGYSGRDYFGAMPVIFTSSGPSIFWVAHGAGGYASTVENWLVSGGRGLFLRMDNDAFVTEVSNQLSLCLPQVHPVVSSPFEKSRRLSEFTSVDEANLLGALILARLGANDMAAECYRATIEGCQAQGEKNRELLALALLKAGHHAQGMGGSQAARCQLAHGIYSQAWALTEDIPRLRLEAALCMLDMQFCLEYIAGRTPVEYLLHAQLSYDSAIEHADPVLTARACGFMGRVLLNCVDGDFLARVSSSDHYEECVRSLESVGAQDILAPLYYSLIQLYGRTGQRESQATASLKFLQCQLLCSSDNQRSEVAFARRLVDEVVRDPQLDPSVREEIKQGLARLGLSSAAPETGQQLN